MAGKPRKNINAKDIPCAGCGELRALCKSHSIPKSFFTKKGRRIHNHAGTDRKVGELADTGWSYLLCETCEKFLGSNLDKPAREWTRKGNLAEIDQAMLARFICSMFWRASISQHFIYKDFCADSPSMQTLLKYGSLENNPFQIGSYTIQKLTDPTGGFTQEKLGTVVMAPTHKVGASRNEAEHHLFRAAFGGMLWTMMTPGIGYFLGAPEIYLNPNRPKYQLQDIDILSDPDLKIWMLDAYDKHIRGQVNVKLRHRKSRA